jgi:polyisoprenyl-phosphate glycosyltransferase
MTAQAKPLLSIVSPVYLGEFMVDDLVLNIVKEVSKITNDFEVILVEDGSPDGSWQKITENCGKDPRVKGIKLSRNFGQHQAITAGLRESAGQYTAVMDCDLQDNPVYIAKMYEKALEGFDIVLATRSKREHPFVKVLFSKLFFALFNWLSEIPAAAANVGSFSLLSRKVVDEFCMIQDVHRHYLLMLTWMGFPKCYVEVKHERRKSGESSYTFRKLFRHAVDGITSQSDKLLKIAIAVGLGYFAISLFAIIYLVMMYFLYGYREGWASTIVLLLFSTGMILMAIGVAGLYVGKIFEQTKNRPLYLIEKKINF